MIENGEIKMQTKITIFTPTYNRAYIIDHLYQSLVRQTNKEFEWVVVDDGSTDNTEEYFQTIMQHRQLFNITYHKQANGGKHRAINRGIKLAKGELFFIVDSDDYLLDDAIEKILKWRNELDDSHKWAGISGARGYSKDRVIGGVYENAEYIDAKNTERKKYHLFGDKAEVYFTNVLKLYPFPEFDGENFLTEEVIWNAIACDGYYLRWYKDIIYITEYLEDGLTRNVSRNVNNPQGFLAWAKGQLKAFPFDIKERVYAIMGYYLLVNDKKDVREISRELGVKRITIQLLVIVRKIKKLLGL